MDDVANPAAEPAAAASSGEVDAKVRRDLDIARAELEGQSSGAKDKVEGVSLLEISAAASNALHSLGSTLGGLFSAKPSETAMDALDGTIDGKIHGEAIQEEKVDESKVRKDLDIANDELTGNSAGLANAKAPKEAEEAKAASDAEKQKIAETLEGKAEELKETMEGGAAEKAVKGFD